MNEHLVCMADIQNMLPAIVSKECFENSLEILSGRRTCPMGSKSQKQSLFAGKVFCGHCGYSIGRKDSKNPYYFCKTLTYSNEYGCSGDHVQMKELAVIVLDVINHSIALACDMKKLWKDYCMQLSDRISAKEQEILLLKDKQERQKQQRVMLYEQYRKHGWTREQYSEERLRLGKETRQCEKIEESLKADLDKLRETQNREDYNRFISTFSQFSELDELTPDLVDELIERIEIFDASHIKVRVKYMDEYQCFIQQMSE